MKLAPFVCLLAWVAPVFGDGASFYPSEDDTLFTYQGRWDRASHRGGSRADWPCSGVQFSITTTDDSVVVLSFRLNLLRVRLHVVVTDASGMVVSTTLLEGSSFIDSDKDYDIQLENIDPGTYTVALRKLTQASPYNNGVGKALKSVWTFHGVETSSNVGPVAPALLPSRRMALIGASDTAGFCVDGTPDTGDAKVQPWKYDNCDKTYHAVLGQRLDADVSVQAIAGVGLTQNAFANIPFLLGKDTMPDFYKRSLQTEPKGMWNFTKWRPDLVVVSLGGNDFNHQKNVPSNATFAAAYEDFLQQIVNPYLDDTPPTIVSVCGQGDPTEVERDPNNDRCRPCPHVEDATRSFREEHGAAVRVEYIFIPCDGTVVTGEDDIGCEGHKNELGQQRVADFLEPRLREIMGWNNPTATVRTGMSAVSHQQTVSVRPVRSVWVRPMLALIVLAAGLIAHRSIRSKPYRRYSSVAVIERDTEVV